MKLRFPLLIAACVTCGTAAAGDGFDGLRCDADVAKALTGRHLSNDRVDVLAARHKDIGLKHLGSEELDWGGEEWCRSAALNIPSWWTSTAAFTTP